MIEVRFRTFVVLLLSVCLIAIFFIAPSLHPEQYDSKKNARRVNWYQANYDITPFGGTWMMGHFGPDVGYGEQGTLYQYKDTLTGAYTSYSGTGLGMGLGGIFARYGGMFGPEAIASYGTFAYGNNPQPASTFGWSTRGATSGSIFGSNTNYFAVQPSRMLGLMGGLFGGFGGLSGFFPGFSMSGYPTNGFGLGGWASGYGWW